MRYVDTQNIQVTDNWQELAKEEGYDPLWSYFKGQFETIVGKKCWYSESENVGSFNPIDHFRPKGVSIKKFTSKNADLDPAIWAQLDCDTRNGYPFLSLEFSNYRYSCDVSNSLNAYDGQKAKGKSNFFPLKLGSPYASNKPALQTEIVCLLDPCNDQDPELLTFGDTGMVEANISVGNLTWDYCRVLTSIEIYNLHYYLFIDKRKAVWNTCKVHIELATAIFKKRRKSKLELDNLTHHLLELHKKVQKTEGFSAVAVDCLRKYGAESDFAWLLSHFPALRK